MSNKNKYIAVVAILMLAVSGFAGRRVTDPDAQAKADYMFLSIPEMVSNGDYVNYYEFASRANELNPSDTTVGFYAGLMQFLLNNGDTVLQARSVDRMRDYVYANPDDYSNARIFSNVLRNMGDDEGNTALWAMLHRNHPKRPEITYIYAQMLTGMGDSISLNHAMALYDSLEVVQGRSLGLSSNKMRLMMMMDDTASVEKELQRVFAAGPAVVENNVFLGDVFMALEKNDSALFYYNRACELDSTNGAAYYSRAEFYQEIGDSLGYQREVLNALTMPSLEPDVKVEIMRRYTSNFLTDSLMFDHLDGIYKNLISLHPHQADLHALYSSYLATRSNFEEAAIQMGYANDIKPDDIDRWRVNVNLWNAAEKPEKALETGNRALKYFPDDTDIMLNLGSIAGRTDTVMAMHYFDMALEHTDSAEKEYRSTIYTYMGDMYSSFKDMPRAIPYYEKAIEAYPENPFALNNLAYFLALTPGADINRAAALAKRSLDLAPDNPSAMDTYAWIQFKLREFKEAKTWIDKALEKTEEPSEELLEHAGDIYFMNGLPDDALEYWKAALEITPDNASLARKVKTRSFSFD